MSLPIQVTDHVHLRIWSTFEAQAACTNFSYLINTVGANTTLADLAAAFDQHCSLEFIKPLSPLAEYEGVQLAIYKPGDGSKESSSEISGEFKTAGGWIGGAGLLPTQCRGLISGRIPVTEGKGGHVRKYIPWPDLNVLDPAQGKPMAPYVTALTTLANQFGPTLTLTVKGNPCVMEQQIYMKKKALWASVPGMLGQTKFATQRRAGHYGKANASPV